ncbi:hypothetical protein ACH5RR_031817 [Cinchona calisaya]|uniref:Uncharacterized protein n=1 Tax=Cinchona calisaya TaxID=153742 RepID=A0ABD2YGC3_9GENT
MKYNFNILQIKAIFWSPVEPFAVKSSSLKMQLFERADVSVTIHEKLNRVIPLESSQYCIFKVHNLLRQVNMKAYEPEIISIGPYHRGKADLQMMEEHKLRYLNLFLDRKKENVTTYLSAMKLLEQKARTCYAEPIGLSSDEFVEMLVLDGCFIIELLSRFKEWLNSRDGNSDPLFKMEWILNSLQRDLMLFENQLPFFVLLELCKMIEIPGQDNGFISLALQFFSDLLPGRGTKGKIGNLHDDFKHLLDLIHRNWSSISLELEHEPNKDVTRNTGDLKLIHCATELKEAGIKFEKMDETVLFDIVFNNGLLRIPTMIFEDRTESFLRNLMAYEQYSVDTQHNIVTDYVTFFGCLIHSAKDVTILSHRGIVHNLVGDNEAVSRIFNKMNVCIVGPSRNFCYAEIFRRVNVYCDRRMNRWMAKLRRKYMDSPWGVISIIAASLLLLFTLTQMIFQILPSKRH